MIYCEEVLEYLVMKIDSRQHGKLKIIIIDYINKLLEELPANMQGGNSIQSSI